MSVYILDNLVNALTTGFAEAYDIKGGIVIDPPADLQKYQYRDLGVIRSETETLEIYDSSGDLVKTIDLAGGGDGIDQTARDAAATAQSKADSAADEASTAHAEAIGADAAAGSAFVVATAAGVAVTKQMPQIKALEVATAASDAAIAKNTSGIRRNQEEIQMNLDEINQNRQKAIELKNQLTAKDEAQDQLIQANTDQLTTQSEQLTSHTNQLTKLGEDLIEVDESVGAAETKITTNTEQIDAIKTKQTATEETIAGLDTKVKTVEEVSNSALTKANENALAINELQEVDEKVVLKGSAPDFESVTTALIRDPNGNMLFNSGGVIGLGIYPNYASFSNLNHVSVKTRAVETRQNDDVINYLALKDYVATHEDLVRHGDSVKFSRIDMQNSGDIINVNPAQTDGDATNLGQVKSLIDGIFTKDIDFHAHRLIGVSNVKGHGQDIELNSDGIDVYSQRFRVRDKNNDFTVFAVTPDDIYVNKDVRVSAKSHFQDHVDFDKDVTFGTNAAVSISNALNMNDHSISNVRKADKDSKATNLGHIKELISAHNPEPKYPTVFLDDLAWTPTGDARTNTKRIITAAPNVCTIIGRHDKNYSGNKYLVVSVGNKSQGENLKCTFVIHKRANGHASGFACTEASGDKVWMRALDGTSGVWDLVTTTHEKRSMSEIDLDETQEGALYFTQDAGLVRIVSDGDGAMQAEQVEGYHVPQLTADVSQHSVDLETLKSDNELGKSRTEHFKNENKISFGFTDPDHAPLVDCYVLATNEVLTDSFIDLTDDNEHKYSGRYNTVGVVAISGGVWSVKFALHNAYKHESENYYIVFDMDRLKWCIVEAENLHTEINQPAAAVTVELSERASLPESSGDYILDVNFEDIESLNFTQADKSCIKTDLENKRILLDFGEARVSGFIVIK